MSQQRTLSDAEYVALTGFLGRTAGLVFDASRRAALAAIVHDRVEATGTSDLGAYLAHVSAASGSEERQRLLDATTIPETQFLRNPPQMIALRERLLPELMRRAAGRGRPLTVWSAGCSTGEEPYSVALLAAEVADEISAPSGVKIIATDINSSSLTATRLARYSGRSLTAIDDHRLVTHFTPVGSGVHEVVPKLRQMVSTSLHNLVTDPAPVPDGGADLIICRNVTIYFSRETTAALVERFHRALAPGGYLLIGHSETLWQISDSFTLVSLAEAFAYRKDVAVDAPPMPRAGDPVSGRRPPRPRPPVRQRPVRASESAESLMARARRAAGDAAYSQAARLAEQAAALVPFDVEAHVLAGWARSTVGDDEGAQICLRKAVYLDPDAGHARFLLAGVLSRCGQADAAAREYRVAAATLPGTSQEALVTLLDGCDVNELVNLCLRLADDLEMSGSTR